MIKTGKIGNILNNICRKIEELDKRKEFAFITLISLVIVLGVTWGMGTLTSGFHLVDDHQFAKWIYQMKYQQKDLFQIIINQTRSDLTWRYRPLYYPFRILGSYIFGINLTAMSVVKALETVVSLIFLYYCGRQMGARKVYALLFSLLSMTGYQSAVWWKLGPQEVQGTILFAIGFYCMLRWLKTDKIKWAIGSIILFILMCNYKESFILLIPFIMLYVLYEELKKEGKQSFHLQHVLDGIRAKFWYFLVLGCIFVISVLIIVFYVGANNYEGVGLDAAITWNVYRDALADVLSKDLKWYRRFGILFGLIALTYWEDIKKLWKEILLTMIFLVPQFIIHGQVGVSERYILPSAIGFAFFFVIVIPKQKFLSGKRKIVYILGLLLLLAAHGRVALREADYFRYRGESITAMLESVRGMADEDINVLSCLRPNEEGNLTINYWMKLHDFDNVYYWTQEDESITKVCDINLSYKQDDYIRQDLKDMDIVVMYNEEDRHWCYTPSLDLSDFTRLSCGTLTVYVRKDQGIDLIEPHVKELKINF